MSKGFLLFYNSKKFDCNKALASKVIDHCPHSNIMIRVIIILYFNHCSLLLKTMFLAILKLKT